MSALGASAAAELTAGSNLDSSPGVLSANPTHLQDFREQFLSCFLGSNTTILLPVVQLIEILNISLDQITPIPHLPAWVGGVYNWRGEVLWIVDLAQLLGIEAAPPQADPRSTTHNPTQGSTPMLNPALANPQLVVLQGQEVTATGTWATLGVLVDQTGDLEWCDLDAIQSPPPTAFTTTLARFLRGYWLRDNGDVFLCPSVDAIFAAMPQGSAPG